LKNSTAWGLAGAAGAATATDPAARQTRIAAVDLMSGIIPGMHGGGQAGGGDL
jgi:hypothetical protein